MSEIRILFVCTANICRSPMAAGMFRNICEKAGRRDIAVDSAGVDAIPGQGASFEAMELMLRNGVHLTSHASKPLDDDLVASASLIVCMAAHHRDAILAQWPEAVGKTRLLLSFNGHDNDLDDPIGGTYASYLACLEKMRPALQGLFQLVAQSPHNN